MPCFGYSIKATSCHIGGKLRKIAGSVCAKCYARKGRYVFEQTRSAMAKRQASLSLPIWTDAMVALIKRREKSGYFRWHDSGDLQSVEHLSLICQVAERLPGILFWLPTKERAIVKALGPLPENLTIRFSAYMIGRTIPENQMLPPGVLTSSVGAKMGYECPASGQGGQCGACRACWDKSVPNIDYPLH